MSIAQWTLIFAIFTQFASGTDVEIPQPDVPPVQETGIASWYGDGSWHGDITANGEAFDPYQYTCAHRNLPFDTMILIENRANQRRVWCRINDRGPYGITTEEGAWDYVVSSSYDENWRGILDMSIATAEALGTTETGLQSVHIRYWEQSLPSSFHLASLTP